MTQLVATNTDVNAICMKCGQPYDAHRPIVSCPEVFRPDVSCGNTGPTTQHTYCAQAYDRGRAALAARSTGGKRPGEGGQKP